MVRLFTRKYKIILTCLLLPLLILSMGGKGYAAEPTLVYLPVSQLFVNQYEYSLSSKQDMGYILERQDPGTPMPDGSVGDQYTLTSHFSEIIKIGPIVFPVPGIYYYELRPTPLPDKPLEQWTVRASDTYTIAAYVRNNQTYTLIITNSAGDKVDEMEYVYFRFELPDKEGERGTDIRDTVYGSGNSNGLDDVEVNAIQGDAADGDVASTAYDPKDTPGTGDDRNLTIWILLAALSFMGILACVALSVYKHRHNREG